jgi:predicted DCC family thiol-disulfide oxidoreductase YuxK
MTRVATVASPPSKPLMIFDGDCNFCRRWIARWQQATGDRVDYLPFQHPTVPEHFPEIPREQFEQAVQLIEPSGEVYSAAEAVFRTLACAPRKHWTLWAYENIPGIGPITECWYHAVARHREPFSLLTRLLWGEHVERSSYFLSRWVFLRLLGVIYLIAFLSLWTQIGGLIGTHGIYPAGQTMQMAHEEVVQQNIGIERYHLLPTLCWISSSDVFLQLLCGSGTVLSVLLIVGVAPAPVLFLLWLCYLSLAVVCHEFLSFQWDELLLETGFLAILFAPLQVLPRLAREAPLSPSVLWLLRWLLFRLMFSSGAVKLSSGDPTWRNLTALTCHYETQPLPTWIAWYANQLPVWFQKLSCAIMFGIELIVPFLFFLPRRPRMFACCATIFLQLLIMATGNYCFFNLLTIALCIVLLDDAALRRFLPNRWPDQSDRAHGGLRWPTWIVTPFAIIILAVSSMSLAQAFRVRVRWPEPLATLYLWTAPFSSINSYGLFAVMTTSRPEIIVEGSDDGVEWRAYEFKDKPGDVKRRPGFVAPHQPRLDWQMWFGALGSYRDNPWFINFCERLLQGSPEVLALLMINPFPDHPPRYIRATMYDYHFTDFATRRAQDTWWRRDHERPYCSVLSLRARETRSAPHCGVSVAGRPDPRNSNAL